MKRILAPFMLIAVLGIGVNLLPTNGTEVEAAASTEKYVGSYTLSPSEAADVYNSMKNTGKLENLITEFLPVGSGFISNNGLTDQDVEEIEKAYHNNVGLIVTIESGALSYEGGTSFKAMVNF